MTKTQSTDKLNIIPSPRYIRAERGQGKTVAEKLDTYFFDGESEKILSHALGFLPECHSADKETAKLILTTDLALAKEYAEIDEDFFLTKNADGQGYILCGNEKGVLIYAKTQTGLAYGVTTLIQLPCLKGDFLIKDCPDFKYRANKWLLWAETEIWSYDFGDGIDAYRERIMRKLDLCLKYKINMVFFDAWGADTERAPYYKGLMRECCRAARERGIHLIFAAYTMGYGLSGHPFGKHFGKVHMTRRSYPDGEIYECLGTMKKSRRVNNGEPFVIAREFGGCLSNGELMELKLEELCNFVREVEPGALYLHNMDSHLIHQNLWLARCEKCRERWPNDDILAKDGMAGAFAEFFDTLNARLQSVRTDCYDAARDLLIFNVSPGYLEYHVSDAETLASATFWEKVCEYRKVSENVYPLFRELYYNIDTNDLRTQTMASHVKKFGTIAFCGGDGFYSDDLFPTTSLMHKMMLGSDVMITCSGNAFAEPLQLFNAEYMWNSTDSGFYNLCDYPTEYEPFVELYHKARLGQFRPAELFAEGGFVDVACRKLYGDDARAMYEFFKLRGENGECPVPHPCSCELFTRGSDGIFSFRWDNEWDESKRDEFAKKIAQIKKVSHEGYRLLGDACGTDALEYRRMLGYNLTVIDLLCEYMSLYVELDDGFKGKKAFDKDALKARIGACKEKVFNAKKEHAELGFDFVDLLDGALARRLEILENMDYDFTLMKKSLDSGERIPADRKVRDGGVWW